MPKLKRTTYRVELDNEDVFEVTPILRDILRGELEGPRHGITDPKSQSIHTTLLWLWSAAVADGHFKAGFQEFKKACTNFEAVKEVDAVQGVPPTAAASPSEPPLHLPADTDTPTTPPPGSSSLTDTPKRATGSPRSRSSR